MQNRTKRFQVFMALILLLLTFITLFPTYVNAGFSIDEGSSMTVYIGNSYTITTTCTSGDHTRSWTPDSAGKLTSISYGDKGKNVNKYMYCTGYLTGSTVATAKCNSCGSTDSITLNVKAGRWYFSSSESSSAPNYKEIELEAGKSSSEYETWNEYDNTGRTWSSSNKNIADFTTRSSGSDTNKWIKVTAGEPTNNNRATATITGTSSSRNCYIFVTVYKKATGVEIDGDFSLYVDGTKQLTATRKPANATDALSGTIISWESSNTSVATVDSSGKVTAKAAGTSTITCTYNPYSGGTKTDTCVVTVYKKADALNDISGTKWCWEDGTTTLSTSVKNGAEGTLTWSSANDAIATVNNSGVVTGKSSGSGSNQDVTITAKFTDKKGHEVTKTCKVNVRQPATGITLDKTTLSVGTGQSKSLTATVAPGNAYNKDVTWSSNKENIATVSAGTVSGVSAGTAVITAKNHKGHEATCTVTVFQSVTSIEITGNAYVYTKQNTNLGVNVLPTSAQTKTVTWEISSGASYATITNAGVVTGVESKAKERDITVKATATDGSNRSDTHAMKVRQSVTGVTISGDTEVFRGKTKTLSVSVLPDYAYSKSVNWSSSNEKVATVDQNGVVSGIAVGSATITATATDGSGKSDTHAIEVKEELTGINIGSNFNLWVGEEKSITATVTPTTYAGTLSWKAENSHISITADGKKVTVKGVSAGSSKLTCSGDTTNVSTFITITVKQQVTSLTITGVTECWVDETPDFNYTYKPTNPKPTDSSVKWEISSGSSYATIDQNGKITPIKAGDITIKITANDGYGATDVHNVKIKQHVKALDITGTMWCWVGKTRQLGITTDPPSGVHDSSVTWSCDTPTVATISTSGVVTGVKAGFCNITATSNDGRGATITESFEVRQQVTKIDISGQNWCWVNKTIQLSATVFPGVNEVYNPDVHWTSGNTGAATIGKTTGIVTGKARNDDGVVITATAADEFGTTKTYTVIIKQQVTNITVSGETTAWVGETKKLTASCTPSNANDRTVSWSSENPAIATVDSKGNVKAQSAGIVNIVVTANDGFGTFKNVPFTVLQQVETIDITGDTWCYVGNTTTLTAKCNPDNVYDDTVTWESSDSTKATINSSTGLVTGKGAGEVTFTATANDGQGATQTYTMTIYNKISGVVMNKTSLNLFVGGTDYANLAAHTTPTTGTRDDTVIWKSNDTTLVTISGGQNLEKNSNAKITLKPNTTGKLGSTTLQANAKDDTSFSAKTTVNLIGFRLSENSILMYVGGSCNLTGLKTTSSDAIGAAYDNVTWKIKSGTGIISLDATSGSVTTVNALKEGTATIEATASADNSVKATCTVTVKDFVVKCNVENIFAPRASVNNPETATFSLDYEAGSGLTVKWTVSVGSSYATLNKTTGDSVVLTPKVIPGKTEVITVRATSTNGHANVFRECSVTIKHPVDAITLSKTSLILFKNTKYDVTASVNDTAYNPRVTWTAPDSVTLAESTDSHKITITAKNSPSVAKDITVKANDDRGATNKITVAVKELYLSNGNVLMYPNSTFELSAFYTYSTKANGAAQSVKWEITEGSDIVNISSTSGTKTTISALKSGTATIKATATEDTSASVTCAITVKDITISFDKEFIYVKEGNTPSEHYTTTAHAKVDGVEQVVTWVSGNTSLATITSDEGVITGLSSNSKSSITVSFTATIAATQNSAEGKKSGTLTIRQQTTGATIKNNKDVNTSSIVVYEGATYQLKAIASPSYAYNTKLNWTVEDTSIATVSDATASSNGIVTITGVKSGVTKVNVTANDGISTKILASCVIQVKGLYLEASSTEIWASRVSVTNPETTTITAIVDLAEGSVEWSIVSGAEYATLSTTSGSKVVLTPKTIPAKTKTVTVRGTSTDADSNVYRDITITLKNPVDTIALNASKITMYTGTSYTFTATINDTAYNQKLDWTVPSQLTGKVSADTHSITLTAGTTVTSGTTLSVKANDGRDASASATIVIKQQYLSATHVIMYTGATYTLKNFATTTNGQIKIANCADVVANWSITSGSDVVKISTASGKQTIVTALKPGTAIIKAVPTDNNASETSLTCTITVEPFTVTIDKDLIFVQDENTITSHYRANATATATTALNMVWSSSDDNLATIHSSNGLITGISTGNKKSTTVTMTATATPKVTSDIFDLTQVMTTATASDTVEIRQQVEEATIQDANGLKTELTIYENTTYQLKAVSLPNYAYNGKLNWAVVGTAIKLDKTTTASGEYVTVTGIETGEATIRVTANDGIVTVILAECKVKVQGLTLTSSSTSIWASRHVVTNPETATLTAHVGDSKKSVNWSVVHGADYVELSATQGSEIVLTPKTINTSTQTIIIRGTTYDGDANTYKELTLILKNPVDEITVPDNSIIMYVNTSLTVNATINSTAYNPKLVWETDSANIRVSSDTHTIYITAGNQASSGNVITATAEDGRGATVTLNVDIRSFKLSATELTMAPGSTYTLSALYTYNNDAKTPASAATLLDVDWQLVYGSDVISMSKTSGNSTVITALKAGTARVRATAPGNTTATLTCDISVGNITVSFDKDIIFVKDAGTNSGHYTTTAHVHMNETEMVATWASSNASYVGVDKNTGVITGLSTNKATKNNSVLTAYVEPVYTSTITDYKHISTPATATKSIEIRQQVTDATISDRDGTERTSLVIYEGTTIDLKATAIPTWAYNTKLNWKVIGDAISVSQTTSNTNAYVTVSGLTSGEATLQVTANDGITTHVLAECKIKVKGLEVVSSVTEIWTPRTVLNNPETVTFFATIDDVPVNTVRWEIVSGSEYATLNTNTGAQVVLTPKTIPSITQIVKVKAITTDADANTSKTVSVTLKHPVDTITLSDNSIIMFTDTSYDIIATINDTAYNPKLDWTTCNSAGVSTTGNGHNITVNAGNKPATTQQIKVDANDGRGATTTLDVAVKELYLSHTDILMYPNSTFEIGAFYTYSDKNNGVEQPVKWEVVAGNNLISLSTATGSKTTISAKAAGTAVIKATATEHTQKSVTCNVTIKNIVLSFDNITLYVKEDNTPVARYTTTAHAKVDGVEQVVTWVSNNAALAAINKNSGAITALSTNNAPTTTVSFTATIAATQNSAEGKQTASITIRQQVDDAKIFDTNNTEVSYLTMYEGTKKTLVGVSYPSYAHNNKLNWSVVGSSISLSKTTTASGDQIVVNANSIGESTIQVKSNDGVSTKILATAKIKVLGLELQTTSDLIWASRHVTTNPEPATLTAYMDGELVAVEWAVITGQDYVSIDKTFADTIVLTPKTINKKTETIVLRATTTNADVNTYKDITVTLKNPIDTITLSDETLILYTDTSYDVDATINMNAYNTKLDWTNPPSVDLDITDSTHGITINAGSHAAARQDVVATANDGRGATASVSVAVKELYLSHNYITMYPNSTFEISSFYTYSDHANGVEQPVKWEVVAGNNLISLSEDFGTKTTISASDSGFATIRATATDDTQKSIECTVVIQGILITFDKEILYVKEDYTAESHYTTKAHAIVNKKEMAVIWESSDPTLATIDATTGEIVALSTNNQKSTTVIFTATIPATANSAEGKTAAIIEIRQQIDDVKIFNDDNEEVTTLTMFEETSIDLTAIGYPDYAYNNKLEWKVVGDKISISKNRTVSGETITMDALSAGTSTIQITSNDGIVTRVLAQIDVRVLGLELRTTSNKIWASRHVVTNPEPITLTSFVDGIATDVKWEVMQGGEFVTLSKELANKITLTPLTINRATETIIVRGTTVSADVNTYKELTITLKNPIDTVELSDETLIMYTNTSYDVTATINMNAYNTKLDWTNPSSVSLDITDSTHGITINAGNVATPAKDVIVKANDGRGATDKVSVAVKELYLSNDAVLMYPNSVFELTAYYTYTDHANGVEQPVKWEVISGKDIVSVTNSFDTKTTVQASKSGVATIRATATDDTTTSVLCQITVKDIEISFDQNIIYIKEAYTPVARYTTTAHATVDGVEQVVTWISHDLTIATIDKNNGLITGLNTHNEKSVTVSFTATIAATKNSAEGKQTGTITVRQQVDDAKIFDTENTEVSYLTMYEGTTITLLSVSTPTYAHNTKLNWRVVGDSIKLSKSVTQTGETLVVTALDAGVSTIQITANDGVCTRVLAECDIKVKALKLTTSSDIIWASRYVVVNPEPATLKSFVDGVQTPVKWEIMQGGMFVELSDVITMENTLTPKTITNPSEEIIIRGTTVDADVNTYKELKVTLKNPINELTLTDYEIIMYTDTSYDVTAMIDNNPYDTLLNWSTPSITAITITPNTHTVTIAASDTPTDGEIITVTAHDGRGATHSMKVIVRRFLLSADKVYMMPGSTVDIKAMYTYDKDNFVAENCIPLDVKWEIVSGSEFITLSRTQGEDITVTGVKAGTAVIKATAPGDATTTYLCTIAVEDIVVSFEQDIIYVKQDESIPERYQTIAHATIMGVEQDATWESSNPTQATIDYDYGAIMGLTTEEQPKVIVTMTASVYPKFETSVGEYVQLSTVGIQSKNIEVRQQVTEAAIYDRDGKNRNTITVYTDETYELNAIVGPDYAHNKKINWYATSDHISFSKEISESGEYIGITGVKPGVTTIQIKSNDGVVPKVLAECEVIVKELTLSYNSVILYETKSMTLNAYSTINETVDQDVVWTIDDESTASITPNGNSVRLHGHVRGFTNLHATTTDADANTTKTCRVEIKHIALDVDKNMIYVEHQITPEENYTVYATGLINDEAGPCTWTISNHDSMVINVAEGEHSKTARVIGQDTHTPSVIASITIQSVDATVPEGNGDDTQVIEIRQQAYNVYPSRELVILYVGTSFDLSSTIGPDYIYDRRTKWEVIQGKGLLTIDTPMPVDDNQIVTISAVGGGNVTIKVSANDGQGAYELIDVVCKDLNFSQNNITFFKRNQYELFALINGISSENVIWEVGDQEIVKVLEDRGKSLLLYGNEVGKTYIKATSTVGDTQITHQTSIEVLELFVEAPIAEMYVGETVTLTAFVNSDPAPAIIWESSDPSIAKVENHNNHQMTVTGVSGGVVEISATTVGYTQNETIKTRVKVLQHVTDIRIETKKDILLYVGGSYDVKMTPYPSNTDTTSFNWGVMDYNHVAKFAENGQTNSMALCGAHPGSSQYKIEANDKFKASVTGNVTVKQLVIPGDIYTSVGDTYTLTAMTSEDEEQPVQWRIEGGCATIDTTSGATVNISANTPGTAKLYATTTDADGNVTLTCNVHIAEMKMSIDKEILYVGNIVGANVTINGVATNCTWTSSDKNVATVTPSGSSVSIKAVGVGKTTITVTSPNGEKQSKPIEVRQPITAIEVDKTEVVIYGRQSWGTVVATVTPADAHSLALDFEHSDKMVSTITTEQEGNKVYIIFHASSNGEDIITIRGADGQGAEATIKVLVKDLTLSDNELVTYVGRSVGISATASGVITENAAVKWSSSNPSIALTDRQTGSNVNIVGLSVGEAVITATSTDGDINTSVSCKVTVKQPVETIELDQSEITLKVNRVAELNIVSLLPNSATDKSVIWTSSDNSVIKLTGNNDSAIIVGLAPGTSTVTVSAKDGQGASATCKVTVLGNEGDTVDVVMYVGGTHSATFDTSDLVNWSGSATWTTSDSTVATVTGVGGNKATINGLKAGTATIVATTKDSGVDISYKFNVTVKSGLSIPTALTMYVGTTHTLSTNGTIVQWKTSNALVAPISSELGKSTVITARDPGVSVITASVISTDVTETYTCTVTVKKATLSVTGLELWLNTSETLTAFVDGVESSVRWSANNSNVTLSQANGGSTVVTGVKAGTAIVTATTGDADVNTSISCNVIVKQSVTKLTMKSTLTVYVGQATGLSVVAMPSTATDARVVWSGYDESLISVKSETKGLVTTASITGLQAGTTTLVATAIDGQGATAECTITVVQRAEKIDMPSEYTIYVGKSDTLSFKVLPENTKNPTLEWFSSNPEFATVNAATGLIKGIAAGTTEITAKAIDGSGIKATCKLTVLQYVTGITLETDKIEIYTNYGNNIHTAQIYVKEIFPANASNKTLGWMSDKPEYITVDENGLLTVQVSELPSSLNTETVTITCYSLDGGGVKAKCTVTLRQHASEVFIIDYEKFFTIENGYITGLTSYAHEQLQNPNITLEIPDEILDVKIVGIRDDVFANCENLIAVTIPATVKSIGATAFIGCENLKDIYIASNRNVVSNVPWGAYNATVHWANGVDDERVAVDIVVDKSMRNLLRFKGTANEKFVIPEFFYDEMGTYYHVIGIADGTFENCTNLASVTMPNSIETIGANAFKGCTNLSSVYLSNSITSIGDYAFANTAITRISIYEAIRTIGKNAFSGCQKLSVIKVYRFNNEVLHSPWGAPNATVEWFMPCTEVFLTAENRHLIGYSDASVSITIPEFFIDEEGEYHRIVGIADNTFYGCKNLTSVIIEDSVWEIGSRAFSGCTNITKITIKNVKDSIEGGPWGATKATIVWQP